MPFGSGQGRPSLVEFAWVPALHPADRGRAFLDTYRQTCQAGELSSDGHTVEDTTGAPFQSQALHSD